MTGNAAWAPTAQPSAARFTDRSNIAASSTRRRPSRSVTCPASHCIEALTRPTTVHNRPMCRIGKWRSTARWMARNGMTAANPAVTTKRAPASNQMRRSRVGASPSTMAGIVTRRVM